MRIYSVHALRKLREDPELRRVHPVIDELLIRRELDEHKDQCHECRAFPAGCPTYQATMMRLVSPATRMTLQQLHLET